MNLKSVFPLVVLLAAPALLSGEPGDYRSVAIRTEQGFLLVWNEPGNCFTLEINGKDAREMEGERLHYIVDNRFLQIVTVGTKEFLGKKRQKPDDREILTAHQAWEGKYLEESNGEKLRFDTSWKTLENGSEALLWGFKLPDSIRQNVTEQIYLTLVKGDHVLMLSTPLTDELDKAVSWQLLTRTAESLKVNDKPVDLKAIQAAIRKRAKG